MRIKLGPNANAKGGFKMLTRDGRDITKELHVTFLSIDVNAETGRPSVFMEVFPDSVDVLAADGEFTCADIPRKGWRRFLQRLSNARISWMWPRFSW